MEKKLLFGEILNFAFKNGLKNFISLIAAFILWILTIWIPYLNVGTTIALFTLPISMSRGKMISPTEIFKGKYRQYMGEFFMLQGLQSIVLFPAMLFGFFPAIVIGLGWSLSTFLLIDKGMDPSKALAESNKLTFGHKWTIFFVYLVLFIPMFIPIFNIIYIFIYIPIIFSAQAFIYKTLTEIPE